MSSDLYEQIVSQRGKLENLIDRIPGFRGYQDKADRRTADRMLREHIAGLIQNAVDRFAQVERRLLDSGGMSYMSRSRSVKEKLQTYHDRLSAAAPGYSGLMAKVKIGDEELARLYAFDEAQIRYVDRINEAIDSFEQAVAANDAAEINSAMDSVEAVAIEANNAFDLREDVLTNLNKSI